MTSKEEIIAKTNAAREARKLARDREAAAVRLQKSTRGWLTRLKVGKDIRDDLDQLMNNTDNATSIELFRSVRNYLVFCHQINQDQEAERIEKLARALVLSLDHDNPKKSYVGVPLNKEYALTWISHMKSLLGMFLMKLIASFIFNCIVYLQNCFAKVYPK